MMLHLIGSRLIFVEFVKNISSVCIYVFFIILKEQISVLFLCVMSTRIFTYVLIKYLSQLGTLHKPHCFVVDFQTVDENSTFQLQHNDNTKTITTNSINKII